MLLFNKYEEILNSLNINKKAFLLAMLAFWLAGIGRF